MRFRRQTSEIEIYWKEIRLFDTHGERLYCASFEVVLDSSQLRNGKRYGDRERQEEGGGDAIDKGAVMEETLSAEISLNRRRKRFKPANGIWWKKERERREWSEDGKVRVKRRGWDTGVRKLRWESDLTENQ